jgi:hypothetical protein
MFMMIEVAPRRAFWLGSFFLGLMIGGGVMLAIA